MGASSDKSQQNQVAQQQIQGNTQQAQTSLQQFLAQNPSILAQAHAPQAPPQMSGAQGGGMANAQPQQIPPQVLQMLAQRAGGAGAPQGQPGPGAGAPHPQPPPAQPPPGLLGLIAPSVARAPGQ